MGMKENMLAKIFGKSDGVSATTHRAMKESGVGPHGAKKPKAKKSDKPKYKAGAAPKTEGTIRLPDGRRVSAKQYESLQKMLKMRNR